MNGYAHFIQKNMPALALDGTLIDPLLLTVSVGKLLPVQKLTAQRKSMDSDIVKVNWSNDRNLPEERFTDVLQVITFKDGLFSPLLDTGIQRQAQGGEFILPQPMVLRNPSNDPITLFLFMSSIDELQFTPSVGVRIS